MHTGRTSTLHGQGQRTRDRGFTLVELLIVIVILGILATVTVFAVRGITDKGQDNAEATELKTFETAVESYWALNGDNPDSAAALVTAELLAEVPTLYTYNDLGDGTYTLTNVRTGDITTLGATGTNAPAPAPAPAPGGWSGSALTIAGVPAVSASNTPGAPSVIWFGGSQTQAAWNNAIDAGRTVSFSGVPGGDTLIMIDIADVPDISSLAAIMSQVENDTHVYSWVVAEDDVPGWCNNSDGDPVPFSVCAQIAAFDIGTPDPSTVIDLWNVADIDPLFDT